MGSVPSRAYPPFDRWPEQLADPRFGRAWFCRPAVFVNQLHVDHATAETVSALHDAIDAVLHRRRAEIAEAGGIVMIHDWRRLQGYSPEARRVYLERMRARAPGYLKVAVAIVPDTPLLRMAVQTANVLMALRIGGTLELATDPEPVLQRYGVRTPLPGWP